MEKSANHLVLVNPSDTGNPGTIIRTILAFDVVDLEIIKPACDIFDPEVIRASIEAVFKIRFEYFESFHDYNQNLEHHLYAFRTNADTTLTKLDLKTPTP